VCDHVAILARGRCVATGSVDEVLASKSASGLLVRAGDPALALAALRKAGMTAATVGEMLRVDRPPEDAAAVTKALADEAIYLTELRPDEADLETVFLELTADKPEEPE
jgi:ABC-2 type transport system ATP-binding protein